MHIYQYIIMFRLYYYHCDSPDGLASFQSYPAAFAFAFHRVAMCNKQIESHLKVSNVTEEHTVPAIGGFAVRLIIGGGAFISSIGGGGTGRDPDYSVR